MASMPPTCPLIALPTEILHNILEYIPDQRKKEGAWRVSVVDMPMLLPISMTCRRLRELTVPYLASRDSMGIAMGTVSPVCGLTHSVITESRSRPLTVDLILDKDCSEASPDWHHLSALWPLLAARVIELHIALESASTTGEPWNPIFKRTCPRLEYFSLYNWQPEVPVPFPSFAQGMTSQLRHLDLRLVTALPQCDFPILTHLALGDVNVSHASIVGQLSRCPQLQSLVIRNIRQRSSPSEPQLYPDLSLPHLRRVVLKDLHYNFLPFCLQKIPKRSHSYSLQVIGVVRNPQLCDAGAILHNYSAALPQTIRIGLARLSPESSFYTLSVTSLNAQSLVRVGTTTRPSGYSASEGPEWLGRTLQDKTALRSVTEIWLVNLPLDASRNGWKDTFDDPLHSIIAALPALKMVSIVYDYLHHDTMPDLRLLPDGREPSFDSPHLKTVQIVYGYDREDEHRRAIEARQYEELLKPRETTQLTLARLVEQLQTGAFNYLDRLVLRVPSHLILAVSELVKLRESVPQVDVQYGDAEPDMPIPEYARELEASGNPLYWTGVSH